MLLQFCNHVFSSFPHKVYISGSALQNFLRNQSLKNCELRIEYLKISDDALSVVSEELHTYNFNLRLKDKMHLHVNDSLSNSINMYQSDLVLTEHCVISVIITHFVPRSYGFSTNLLSLTNHGFCVPVEHNLGKPQYILTALAMRDIFSNQTQLFASDDHNLQPEDYFAIICEQSILQKNGQIITVGLDHSNKSEDDCAICYKTGVEMTCYVLTCGHKFCAFCIDQHRCSLSLALSQNCPICRTCIEFNIVDTTKQNLNQ